MSTILLKAALALVLAAGGGGEPVEYAFREAPLDSSGLESLGELRGRPVLIDFWGTR